MILPSPYLQLTCLECGEQFSSSDPDPVCPGCDGGDHELREDLPLTRAERLQAAADAGVDTWDEYKGDV
jgi:Zn finger protein HypA/HybF involved in hydrogenase expression